LVTNDLYFRIVDNSAAAYQGIVKNDVINSNTWYHIVGVYDGSSSNAGMSLYINGQLQSTSNSNGGSYTAMENTTVSNRIGKRDSFFKGTLDDARIYARALTTAEVQLLYQQGL